MDIHQILKIVFYSVNISPKAEIFIKDQDILSNEGIVLRIPGLCLLNNYATHSARGRLNLKLHPGSFKFLNKHLCFGHAALP